MEMTPDLAFKAGGLLVTIGGLVALFKRHEKDFDSHKRTIWQHMDAVKSWQERYAKEQAAQNLLIQKQINDHEKDAARVRLELQGDISKLQIANAKTEEKFTAIMNMLEEIKANMNRRRNGDLS